MQHKYADTVLLLCNEVCGAYCRYCFRKRLFMDDNGEVTQDVSAGIAYIREHPEVSNVLLTDGDPLIMSARRLREIFAELREIEHVRIIRIGSKIPAFDPFRILRDEPLQDALRTYSTPDKCIYLMAHFDHPRELTPAARAGIAKFIECGVICVNQCPLIRGVNDNADTLAELWRELSYAGCTPYYVFQGRPTAGNDPYEVPMVRGWEIFRDAVTRESGLAGRVRFAMSHETGKIEVCGVDARHIHMRYHRSKYPQNRGLFFTCQRNDDAYWLDQLVPAVGSAIPYGVPFDCFGGKPSGMDGSNGNGRSAGNSRLSRCADHYPHHRRDQRLNRSPLSQRVGHACSRQSPTLESMGHPPIAIRARPSYDRQWAVQHTYLSRREARAYGRIHENE